MKTLSIAPLSALALQASALRASRRYLTLGGAWAAWLFDALDATVFGLPC